MAGLLLVAAFGAVVDALAVEMAVAQPTHASASTPALRFPQITAPPSVHELIRRQEAQTYLKGPDNTCGYFDGISSEAYYCMDSAALCALVTYSTTGAAACCKSSTCGFVMDCVDYRQIRTSSACDSECMADDITLKCSNAATPYCGTVTFFSGIQDYYCMTTPYSAVESIYTTWVGQDDGRRFTPIVETITTGNPDPFGTGSANGGGGGPVNTVGGGRSSGIPVPGATPSSPSSPSHGGGGSSSTGAIVGGAVGGVAVLTLLGLGIFFIVRHGKKHDKPIAPPPPPPMAQEAPHYHPPGPGYVPPASPPPTEHHHQPGYAPAPAYYPAADAPAGGKPSAQTYTHTYAVPPSPASPAPPTDPQRLSMVQPPPPPPPPSTSPTATEGAGGALAPLSQNPSSGYQLPEQQQQQQLHSSGLTSGSTVFYESGGDVVGARGSHANHRGQFHEMG